LAETQSRPLLFVCSKNIVLNRGGPERRLTVCNIGMGAFASRPAPLTLNPLSLKARMTLLRIVEGPAQQLPYDKDGVADGDEQGEVRQ
jgi:hypothetical protein